MIGKLENENKIECLADDLYKMWKVDYHKIPHLIPNSYKSVDLLEGGNGTREAPVKLWRYVYEGKTIYVKEKTTCDDEKRSVCHVVMGGVLFDHFKSFEAKVIITPIEVDGHVKGSMVKWELEFEKKNEDVPDPTGYLTFFEQATKDLDCQMLLTKDASFEQLAKDLDCPMLLDCQMLLKEDASFEQLAKDLDCQVLLKEDA